MKYLLVFVAIATLSFADCHTATIYSDDGSVQTFTICD